MNPNSYLALWFLFVLTVAGYVYYSKRKWGVDRSSSDRMPAHTANEAAVLKVMLTEAYMENAMLKERLRAFEAQPHE